MFPMQEPRERQPPSKNLHQVLRVGSSSFGFLFRNIVTGNPPGGGGFFRSTRTCDRYQRCQVIDLKRCQDKCEWDAQVWCASVCHVKTRESDMRRDVQVSVAIDIKRSQEMSRQVRVRRAGVVRKCVSCAEKCTCVSCEEKYKCVSL